MIHDTRAVIVFNPHTAPAASGLQNPADPWPVGSLLPAGAPTDYTLLGGLLPLAMHVCAQGFRRIVSHMPAGWTDQMGAAHTHTLSDAHQRAHAHIIAETRKAYPDLTWGLYLGMIGPSPFSRVVGPQPYRVNTWTEWYTTVEWWETLGVRDFFVDAGLMNVPGNMVAWPTLKSWVEQHSTDARRIGAEGVVEPSAAWHKYDGSLRLPLVVADVHPTVKQYDLTGWPMAPATGPESIVYLLYRDPNKIAENAAWLRMLRLKGYCPGAAAGPGWMQHVLALTEAMKP